MYVIEISIHIYFFFFLQHVMWQHNVAWNLCEFSFKIHIRNFGGIYHF